MATILRDGNLALLDGKVAIIGYGSQGHAHALNLATRAFRSRWPARGLALLGRSRGGRARRSGRLPRPPSGAQLVAMLLPDQVQPQVFAEHVEPNLAPGAAVLFAHGFNVLYGRIAPAPGHDVIMVAPKGPGHVVRRLFTEGYGTPALIAVEQDASAAPASSRSRTPSGSAPAAPGSSRRRSGRRPRPTSSASRRCSAAASPSWSGRASRRSSRPGTSRRSRTTSASTS